MPLVAILPGHVLLWLLRTALLWAIGQCLMLGGFGRRPTRQLEGPVSSIPCDDCTNVHDAPESNKASSIAALKADSSACFCWRCCFLRSSRRAHLLDILEIGRGLASSMQQLT
jgi:hypothetical protein